MSVRVRRWWATHRARAPPRNAACVRAPGDCRVLIVLQEAVAPGRRDGGTWRLVKLRCWASCC